jgi:hypothetical protein
VTAFGGDGGALARNVMIGKVAPAFQSILTNSDGPLMDLFSQFATDVSVPVPAASPASPLPGPLAEDESADPSSIPSNPFSSTAEANR